MTKWLQSAPPTAGSSPRLVRVPVDLELRSHFQWKPSILGVFVALSCWLLFVAIQAAMARPTPVATESQIRVKLQQSLAEQDQLQARNARLEALVEALRVRKTQRPEEASTEHR